MGNRFTRNIQNVRNIDKLPLNTNEQNDLISDTKASVYVRNGSSYERITGLKKLEDEFNVLWERLKDFDPNNEEVEDIIKKINDNKKELENKIKDVNTYVENLEIPNYDDDIKHLNSKIDDDIKKIQDELNAIEFKDYEEDIKMLNNKIDNLEIPNYDNDIKSLNDALNELEIPDLSEYVKTEDTDNWQKYPLTDEKGRYVVKPLGDKESNLHELEPGNYYATSVPIDNASSTSGFMNVLFSGGGTVKRIVYQPYDSSELFIKRFYKSWSDWERHVTDKDYNALLDKINQIENDIKELKDVKE